MELGGTPQVDDPVLADVAALLHEVVGADPATVRPEQRFVDDLGVDSLSMVEIIVAVAERSGVVVPDAEVKHLVTVQDLVDRIGGSET